jgi:D-3-phosphoglycerate dehydrogenase
MKPGAVFVNTSRGGVQDEQALHEALATGRLRAAGLDVWQDEPPSPDNPLLALDTVVCTPHVAGVSEEADLAIALDVVSDMLRVLRGVRPRALGNPEVWARRRSGP